MGGRSRIILEDKLSESHFIKIKTGKNYFKITGNIYRPPGSNITVFLDKLQEILNIISLDQLLSKAEEGILMGDFNINLLNHDNHVGTSNYLNTLLNFGQLPLITLPSRVTYIVTNMDLEPNMTPHIHFYNS